MKPFSRSLHPSSVAGSQVTASTLPPLILIISMRKIKAEPPGILGGLPLSPYARSDGMYISHLSPSTISCMASVHPLITWLGANVAGAPRSYDESNLGPSVPHSDTHRETRRSGDPCPHQPSGLCTGVRS